ncbi:secreted RxLR effector protein 161-like [Lactuca sativa]|uniref:secreted RxLR effector protein 161-like n=1 Tax=Lactuca sativa TaxID=4236 RepID=UPI001C68E6D5|nr:secreted RxLR effector protein 161-like [Lactuca sativa]
MEFLFVKLNILQNFLKMYGFSDCKPAKTSMSSSTSIGADLSGTDVTATLFQGMIGSLLYLTASRPDIMFATILCARYQDNPKESPLIAVKRIFCYLKHTPNLGLWYPHDSEFKLVGYTDSDHGGCGIDHKNTSGGAQMLGNRLVRWSSKKQTSVACSSVGAEYVVAGRCCTQILWIQN